MRMVSAGSCICACMSIVCISSFLPSTSTPHCPCNTERKESEDRVKSCMISNKNWPKFFDTRQLVMGQKQTAFETIIPERSTQRRTSMIFELCAPTRYHLLSQGQKNGGDNVCIYKPDGNVTRRESLFSIHSPIGEGPAVRSRNIWPSRSRDT